MLSCKRVTVDSSLKPCVCVYLSYCNIKIPLPALFVNSFALRFLGFYVTFIKKQKQLLNFQNRKKAGKKTTLKTEWCQDLHLTKLLCSH